MRHVIAVLGLAIVIVAIPAGLSSGSEDETGVVCIKDYPSYEPQYRVEPRHCIFHKRHEPNAEAFFVRTKRVHWKSWRSGYARGKGKGIASMIGSTPIKLELSRPVTRCGHRVFSKLRVRYPKLDAGGRLAIDTCA